MGLAAHVSVLRILGGLRPPAGTYCGFTGGVLWHKKNKQALTFCMASSKAAVESWPGSAHESHSGLLVNFKRNLMCKSVLTCVKFEGISSVHSYPG